MEAALMCLQLAEWCKPLEGLSELLQASTGRRDRVGCWSPFCSLVPNGLSFGAPWVLAALLWHCRAQMLCCTSPRSGNAAPLGFLAPRFLGH